MEFKEKVMQEVDTALSISGETPIGFIAVVLTECDESGKVVPTVIDTAHAGLGKINDDQIRESFHNLGKVIAAKIYKPETP